MALSMTYFNSSESRAEDINSTSYPPPRANLICYKSLEVGIVANDISFDVGELLSNVEPHFEIMPRCGSGTIYF